MEAIINGGALISGGNPYLVGTIYMELMYNESGCFKCMLSHVFTVLEGAGGSSLVNVDRMIPCPQQRPRSRVLVRSSTSLLSCCFNSPKIR